MRFMAQAYPVRRARSNDHAVRVTDERRSGNRSNLSGFRPSLRVGMRIRIATLSRTRGTMEAMSPTANGEERT